MKFIDLHDEIEDDLGSTRAAIERILEWLDEHPDQVPGRTITESESKDLFNTARQGLRYWPDALERAGIAVAPDPEPTNAEKATADLEAWGIHRAKALELGPWLAGQGWTKAPGGDDE